MKKIILIDDNSKNQREAYGAYFVDDNTYTECLFHIEKLNSKSDLSFLDDALCVMMHDSLEDYIDGNFIQKSHRAKDLIEQVIQDCNIPYVLFSDGHGMTADWREETPNVIYSIKKSEFYIHLEEFIKNYLISGILDFRIIAYGKDFIKQLISNWGQYIFSVLNKFDDDNFLELSMFDTKAKRMLMLVIENSQPKIGISFNDLMCEIEDGNVTVGKLRTNINNVISSVKKYGKNISAWQ